MTERDKAPVVLVVEDHEDIRELYAEVLRARGYTVFEAPDAPAAVAIAIREEPAVTVMDLALPGMSGVEAIRALRNIAPVRQTRILVVSAHDSAKYRLEALEAGADAFFAKPVTGAALADEVDRLATEHARSIRPDD